MLRKLAFMSVLLAPGIAAAQPIQGLYIGAGAGANFAGTLKSAGDPVTLTTRPGPAGVASLGWGFGNGLRAEIEGSIRSNGISGISTLRLNGQHLPLSNVGGDVRSYAAMANVLYDIPLRGFALPVVPYVGAGAGYSWLDLGNAGGNGLAQFVLPRNNSVVDPDRLSFGTAGAFAYQAIAGIAAPIAAVPGLQVTLEYRFLGSARADIPVTRVSTSSNTVNGTVPSSRTRNEFNLVDNAVTLGLRYAFGAPRPAAAVEAPVGETAPAPTPARTYLVFFDWDKATLTDRARQIVAEAATASTHVAYTRIAVDGYTDTSGTPRYNQALSVRRAESVAAELVKDGVPRAAISIQGFGETHLLVPTAAGVREPQNRRVEIIIR